MPCLITSGRKRPCKDSISGVVAVYFANFLEDSVTVLDGEVTGLNPSLTEVFKYELRGDNNTFEQTISGDGRNNGTTIHTKTTTIALQKQDPDTQNEIKLLARANPIIFVEDRAGNIFAAGIEEGNDLSSGTSTTGGAIADFNGYNVTFVSDSREPAPFLDATTKDALKALVSTVNIEP